MLPVAKFTKLRCIFTLMTLKYSFPNLDQLFIKNLSPDSLCVGRVERKSASLIPDVAGDVTGDRGLNPNRKRDIFNLQRLTAARK